MIKASVLVTLLLALLCYLPALAEEGPFAGPVIPPDGCADLVIVSPKGSAGCQYVKERFAKGFVWDVK